MEGRIRKAVEESLAALGVLDVSFVIERPSDMAHGDYAVNAALLVAKPLGKKPQEVAEVISASLRKTLGYAVSKIEVAGPGFVNITLSPEAVREAIQNPPKEKSELAGKRVMIEYGNTNPFKEMHIGHLVGTVIGESIARLSESAGATVLRDTYGGDVGPHVAKALFALRARGVTDVATAKEIGDAYAEGSRAYEEGAEAKSEIDALNTRIYEIVAKQDSPQELSDDDRAILGLWRKGRDVSIEEFGRLFSLLGTKFDFVFHESETSQLGLDAVRDGVQKGIFEESEGAVIYRGEKKGLHTLVFITSRGTPTYETKDIGLAFLKEMRAQTDEVIIIAATEQIGHFKVFFAALEEIAPLIATKTKHVANGLLRLTSGKMSSREGNIITASALISDLTSLSLEKNPDPVVAEQVAVAALKYIILRQAPGGDITFDPEKSLSLEGDSGPYLQYALVRARKILAYEGNGASGNEVPAEPYAIERLLIHYPAVVARASRERAPHHVAQYLTELAGAWNSFYAKEQVLGSSEEEYKMRVAHAFASAMSTGLTLLGIPTPEKM